MPRGENWAKSLYILLISLCFTVKVAGVLSVWIEFSRLDLELEVVGDGVCIDVPDGMGGMDTDNDIFPLEGVFDFVFVWELPTTRFPVRRRSASVAASWGKLCRVERGVGSEFNTGGGAMGMFPHPVSVPGAPSPLRTGR